jgi:L-lactate dehydrogenase
MPSRVVVIGAGHVGATFAYALVHSGLASEVVLVDADPRRSEGEAMDIAHAVPFHRPARVWAGTWADCAGASIVVITAGGGQRPGQTRLDLLRKNAAIIADVVPRVIAAAPEAILLIATNPVDVLTLRARELSGLPASRVIGSGTILDTARFRHLLGERLGVDPRSIHAFIVGEHGDSEVPVWSRANVAGVPLEAFCRRGGIPFDQAVRDEVFAATRDAAYAIIERKGSTYYAIASGLVRICEAILRDQRTILSVSTLMDGPYGIRDVCLSLPTVVDAGGAASVVELELDDTEASALQRSAEVLRAARASLGGS